MSEYEIGITAPPFHVFCRSTTAPYFNDEFTKNDKRVGRDVENKTLAIPANMSYNEWKEIYINETGAISGALNPFSDEANKFAVSFYEETRKRKSDIEKIAKRSGMSIQEITDIKNYIFFEKHHLIKGYKRFDEDYNMAQSWQRLQDENMQLKPQDIVMLKHELLEREYERKGYSHNDAHNKANEKYNYAEMIKKGK